ncbi:MAG: L-aspartate oxidase [Candidatus Obscuribacterales bacterium]|nr:L-aspartate oxidase [Candidatus Obscuribacterales bacterium]
MPELHTKKVDAVIIGSGLAGLLLANQLVDAGRRVLIATKGELLDSNTRYAQGGLAAVLKDGVTDSRQAHLKDTIKSGAGLVDEAVAEQIINGGAELVEKLSALGVHFDKTETGSHSLHLEGGHNSPRVLHSKDTTGKTIAEGLVNSLKARAKDPNDLDRPIILENTFALDILHFQATPLAPRVATGVLLLTDEGVLSVAATYIILATGGAGQIFTRTTNPKVATGDGIALAARAGAKLADLEFVQFHPTAFCKEGQPAFLVSEAVRGQGAILVDDRGHRFAFDFHNDGELATRDTVAKAIHQTMADRNLESVYLDMRPIGTSAEIEAKFPNIVETLRKLGVDPVCEPIPVCPAAHYYMGGIAADAKGQTSLLGLYALGESAATGLHGANRLASNSLLEAGVMALNLAKYINSQPFKAIPYKKNAKLTEAWFAHCRPFAVPADRSELKALMYRGAGLVRDAASLTNLEKQLDTISIYKTGIDRYDRESANMLLVAKLIVKACSLRQESRGGHVRSDFPTANNSAFLHHITFEKGAWRTQSAGSSLFTSTERAVSLARQ